MQRFTLPWGQNRIIGHASFSQHDTFLSHVPLLVPETSLSYKSLDPHYCGENSREFSLLEAVSHSQSYILICALGIYNGTLADLEQMTSPLVTIREAEA